MSSRASLLSLICLFWSHYVSRRQVAGSRECLLEVFMLMVQDLPACFSTVPTSWRLPLTYRRDYSTPKYPSGRQNKDQSFHNHFQEARMMRLFLMKEFPQLRASSVSTQKETRKQEGSARGHGRQGRALYPQGTGDHTVGAFPVQPVICGPDF